MLLAATLTVARPLAYAAVARVARDVALWSVPAGLVSGLRWHEALERFVLDSLSLGVAVRMDSLSLAFVLVIPAAYTLALPLPGRLRAASLQLAACFTLGSAILAHDLLAIVSRTLAAQGIAVFGPWRKAFYEAWLRSGWDFAMIAVPAAACLWASLPLLVADDGEAGGRRLPAGSGRWLAVGLVGALLAADLTATRRSDASRQEAYLKALAEREPELPRYFLGRGLHALERGRLRDAAALLERARLFPSTEASAARALASLAEGSP